MKRYKSLAAASFALLLLAACSSSGMGDIFGGGADTTARELRGTVDYVDVNSRSVYLTNVSGYSMLSGGSNSSSVRVYYDDQTSVDYQGRSYRPADLERGDQVAVRVDQSGNNLIAESMTVTYNAASGTGTVPGGTYNSTVSGTVRSINTSNRSIEIDRGYGSTTWVEFETNTPVYYNNTTYRPADLERGDQVEIRVRDIGSGRLLAQDMTVIRSVSGGTTGSSSSYATLRGTVRSVDTVRRTIQLESTSWISGFTTGGTGSVTTVQYGSNTSVDVQGKLYPVANLERGDVIEIQVTNAGSTLPTAQSIYLLRDANLR